MSEQAAARVTLKENGPLILDGDFTVEGAKTGKRAALCRCGQSARKPLCDGGHEGCGFVAEGSCSPNPDAEAPGEGPVTVVPLEAGPLELTGDVALCAEDANTLQRAPPLYPCRCGLSANKPYCDGSHKAAGFTGA